MYPLTELDIFVDQLLSDFDQELEQQLKDLTGQISRLDWLDDQLLDEN